MPMKGRDFALPVPASQGNGR